MKKEGRGNGEEKREGEMCEEIEDVSSVGCLSTYLAAR